MLDNFSYTGITALSFDTKVLGLYEAGNDCCSASKLLGESKKSLNKKLPKGFLTNEICSSFKVWSLIVWFILLQFWNFRLISNYIELGKYVKISVADQFQRNP